MLEMSLFVPFGLVLESSLVGSTSPKLTTVDRRVKKIGLKVESRLVFFGLDEGFS